MSTNFGTSIREVFGTDRVLLPVLHPPRGVDYLLNTIRSLVREGIKGVWLINQGMPGDAVIKAHTLIVKEFPDMWVGVNLLNRNPIELLPKPVWVNRYSPDGIWTDNANIYELRDEQPEAEAFRDARSDWRGLYFGGVAFKYQRYVEFGHLSKAAEIASKYVDVICTSGPGTGLAMNVDRMEALYNGASKDIAIASGITIDNIDDYLPFAKAFLVGTGIEKAFGVLDIDKTFRLRDRIESWI